MKKLFIILTSLLVVFIFLIILNTPEVIIESDMTSPQKPESVPNSALWAGGVDGGNFITVETYKNEDKLFSAKPIMISQVK